MELKKNKKTRKIKRKIYTSIEKGQKRITRIFRVERRKNNRYRQIVKAMGGSKHITKNHIFYDIYQQYYIK